jgi:uncharacterized protein
MSLKHFSRPFAVKTIAEDGSFIGYGSVFDVADSYSESVAAGAFQKSLSAWRAKGLMPAMLWMHDPTKPVGVWDEVYEDANGLVVRGQLALNTQAGLEAYELLKMGALTGLSIGYRTVASRIDSTRGLRVLTELELFEVSLVTFPANDLARVSAVKTEQALNDDMRAIVANLNQAARILCQ